MHGNLRTSWKAALRDMERAGFDRGEKFKRSDADTIIGQVESAILRFDALPDRQVRKFFLVCFLAWENMRRN